MSKIRIVLVEPCGKPRVVMLDNTLNVLQQTVGGYIEVIRSDFSKDILLVFDEDAKFKGKPFNRYLCDQQGKPCDSIAGTFFMVAASGEEFASLTEEQCEMCMERYGANMETH